MPNLDYSTEFAVGLDQTIRTDSLEKNSTLNSSPGDLYWEGDVIHLAGLSSADCSNYRILDSSVMRSLKFHIVKFATLGRYAKLRPITIAQIISASLEKFPARTFDKPWLLGALTLPVFRGSKALIENFFVYWKAQYPQAITAEALQELVKTKITNIPSSNALSDDPEKSWLTDIEYDVLVQAIWTNYDTGLSDTQVTLLRMLSMQYARRPVQLAHLKIGDFQNGIVDDAGVTGRRVRFPGAKDRTSENGFRNSKFEVHPIADHLWDLFQIQRVEIRATFEKVLGITLSEDEVDVLPLFSITTQIRKAKELFVNHYQTSPSANLSSELFHILPKTAAIILQWITNKSKDGWEERTSNIPAPISHRTGRAILINSTRMRHTRARQLARLGMPKHVLSFWMGHTTERSLAAYYNDPAEEARQLNEAMGAVLMPMALAFAGKLIDDESQASRGDDPESRLEFVSDNSLKGIGNCGKHSFCATTSIPIPCYRCKQFEPLVYAHHGEVLNALESRQAEENKMIKIGGSRRLVIPINLSKDIRAVSACIARCNARKAELEKN